MRIGGIDVIVTDLLPMYPGHKEDARRIVRHGMEDILEWLGEKVGPKPGELTVAILTGGNRLMCSAEYAARITGDAE